MQSLALYIHWPFCLSKCPYCDFNSHVQSHIDINQWEKALLSELRRIHSRVGQRTLTSIYFGGGTPSLMPSALVEKLIHEATHLFSPTPNIEITLEANPNTVEINRFRDFQRSGVNRVSMGIQSLRPNALSFLGRTHSASEAINAIQTAQKVFDRFSFDLIYARPEQTLKDWVDELTEALSFGTTHLSVYQLTIEQGTAFYTRHQRGEFTLPPDELAGELYEVTQDLLASHGLFAYEVSNHARPGVESQHNLSYWRYDDYAGIGPGAHGRLTLEGQKYATKQVRAPALWLSQIETNGHGDDSVDLLQPEEQFWEALMMGLRVTEGIDLAKLPLPLETQIEGKTLNTLIQHGFLELTPQRLKATPQGRQRLNAVLERLVASK